MSPLSSQFERAQVKLFCPCGGCSSSAGHLRAASGIVDAFAELFQLRPDPFEPFRLPFLNFTFWSWTDIKEQISVTARTNSQATFPTPNHIPSGLHFPQSSQTCPNMKLR